MKLLPLIVTGLLAACGSKPPGANANTLPEQKAATSSPAVDTKALDITSAYTKFDYDECTILELDQETGFSISRCSGYASIPLFLIFDDARDDLDVGTLGKAASIEGPIHHASKTVEWRLAGGKPFAIIYRVETSPPYAPWSRLIVETIGRPGKPGCPVADFDALKPNANVLARHAADRVLTGRARCISFVD